MYSAGMRKYKKITLEIEIAVISDDEITEDDLDKFVSKARRGLKDALKVGGISFGGIQMRTIVDIADRDEVKKINDTAYKQRQ
jgi:hypothetical protein